MPKTALLVVVLVACGKPAGVAGDSGIGIDASGDGASDAAADGRALDASADAGICVPMCGAATCGDDGCGGSCGQCTGTDYCGGGGPGMCGSAPVGMYPGVTPVQLDSGTVLGLRVAHDERHILIQRTESPSYTQGALAVVTIDAAGHGSAIELTTAVDFSNGRPEAEFDADSTGLFYVDGSTSPRRLMAAAADGSGAHVVATGTIQTSEVEGTTLVYTLALTNDGNRSVGAVTLPSGTPVELVAAGAVYYPQVQVSPTGAAVFVADEGSQMVHELIQTATGAVTPLGTAGTVIHGAWSPDGSHFVYWTGLAGLTIHVIDADGTGDTLVTSSGLYTFVPRFSPDGALLAYGTDNGSGSVASVVLHPVAGGSDRLLAVDPAHLWGELVEFTDDSDLLAITSLDSRLAVAPTDHSGTFAELASGLALQLPLTPCSWSLAHDHAAAIVQGRHLSVAPTGGGTAHVAAAPIDEPGFYEPVATTPGLLAFTSTNPAESGIAGKLALFASDGTGAARTPPGTVLPAFTQDQEYHVPLSGWHGSDSGSGQEAEPFTWGWLGSELVYESNRDTNNPWFDLIAATDTLGTVGVIAPGARVWGVRDGLHPTHVAFTRPALGGLWWSSLPQTPGR